MTCGTKWWISSGAGRTRPRSASDDSFVGSASRPASFMDWRQRYGCVNEHNGWIPRDFWLELWEKEAIIDFHLKNPLGRLPAADVHVTDLRTWPFVSGHHKGTTTRVGQTFLAQAIEMPQSSKTVKVGEPQFGSAKTEMLGQ